MPSPIVNRNLLLPIVLLLASCEGGEGSTSADKGTDGSLPPGATETAVPWTLDESRLAEGALLATRVDCESVPYRADVRWVLLPHHGAEPQIWLANPAEAPKLWVAPSRREGGKQTGAWLTDATVLYLVDGTSESVIARLRMDAISCDRAPADEPASNR